MTTTDPLNQAAEILNAEAVHLARVGYLNRIYNQLNWKQVTPEEVVFHEIPGKPGLLRYEHTQYKPAPVPAAHVVGPKPTHRLTGCEKWVIYAGSVLADIIEKVRRSR